MYVCVCTYTRKERSFLAERLRVDFLEVVAYEQGIGGQEEFQPTDEGVKGKSRDVMFR